MNTRVKWIAVLAMGTFASLLPGAAFAEEGEGDHEVARELYQHGDIKSLEDILSKLKEQAPGDVVGVELVRVTDRWVYRFQVVAADGHRSIVDVDAGSVQAAAQGRDD